MLVILDWDGTVCNSEARIVACMQRAAERAGMPVLAPDAIGNIIGLGLPEALNTLFPEISMAERQQVKDYYVEAWLDARVDPLPLFDGVLQTLDKLLGNGHRLAVATGKSRQGLNREFSDHGVRDLFVTSRCADETASKPHPLMLQEILGETGFTARDSVMVGDTVYDLEMAASAGMPAIGVSYGVHHPERLQGCAPVAIIDHFSELLEWPPLTP